jgi:hypothetical protein
MAQLGDLARATQLLRSAARAFGTKEPMARARCDVADAEISLVSRVLGRPMRMLDAARATLEKLGDRTNAAHAGYLDARRLLVIGQLDEAERVLDGLDADALPLASKAGLELVAAGIAMRRIRTKSAHAALDRAALVARQSGIHALEAEIDSARRALEAPAARLIAREGERLLGLEDVEVLLASDALIVDACRNVVRAGSSVISLASRPVLFALAHALAEGWPEDVSREKLLARAFRARHTNESYRARLRVEIGRLRKAIKAIAALNATKRGFVLESHAAGEVVILVPPVDGEHAELLALLADGEAWSSSALALALGVSPRTVQRSLEALAEAGKVETFGSGPACRWIACNIPGFPTSLLLPAPVLVG